MSGACFQKQGRWQVREERAGWRVSVEAITSVARTLVRGEALQAQGLTPCCAA